LWLLHMNVWEITRCVLVHCYRKMNIIWKLCSCHSQYCKHPIIVQRKTNCISLCDWGMKLGVLPLWSATKELSNNVLKVIIDDGHIFAKNGIQAKAIIHGFFMILGENSTHSKIGIIWKLYSCWSQWFKFQIHISLLARDTYHNSYPVYPVHEWWLGLGAPVHVYMNEIFSSNEALFVLNSIA